MSKHSIKIMTAILGVVLAVNFTVSPALADKSQKKVTTAKEVNDPIEPVNRFIFGFNDILDHILIEPLAKGYKAVVPTVIRDSVRNFMRNLSSPLIVANDLLQGKFSDAGTATARFLINTTAGVAGLADVAGANGLAYKSEDFGQTLATWGAGDGFYLVLPIIGPSSLRDTAGLAVDSYADPVRIISDNTDHDWIYYAREGLEGLDTRARLIDAVDDMRRNSLDYYAAARSAYIQRRQALIRDEQPAAPGSAVNSTDHP